MSKAFTREETEGPDLPDLPLPASALPPGAKNYLTREGAERLRSELTQLIGQERPRLVESGHDPELKRRLSKVDQRIFQLEQSLQTAEVVSPPPGPAENVTFGVTVTVRDSVGTDSTYRIVGVDEIDADLGRVSWLSPIARALMNAKHGQRVHFKFPTGEEELEVIGIAYE